MGASLSPYMTTIGSSDPAKDADFFEKAFPSISFERDEGNPAFVFLMEQGTERTLVFQKCKSMVGGGTNDLPNPVWTVRPEEFDFLLNYSAAQDKVSLSDERESHLVIVKLPGGTSVACISSDVMGTKEGRQSYVKALARCKKEIERGKPSSVRFLPVQGNGTQKKETSEDDHDDPSLPTFKTLSVSLLQQEDQFLPYRLNARKAIPIETELFKGQFLLILRPKDPLEDPYWNERIFSKKKRRFILQLQGKFKRNPRGTLYAGAEVSEPMRLGLVAKGMCSILLNVVRSFNSTMYYSFGDEEERARIVIPAWNFFEKLVVTKPGETPPPMGEEFPETKDAAKRRKASQGMETWNTEDTFSMSCHSMYMDMAQWQIVNVPVTRDVDLQTFWGKSFLDIVLYENMTPTNIDKHLHKHTNYFFSLRMKNFPNGKNDEQEEVSDNGAILADSDHSLPWHMHTRRINSVADFRLSLDDTDLGESTRRSVEMEEAFMPEDEDDDYYDSHDFFYDAEEMEDIPVQQPLVTVKATDSEALGKLRQIDTWCPAMIEMSCKGGKYVHVYAFNLPNGNTVFRKFSTIADTFDLEEAKKSLKTSWSPRLSAEERTRRVVGYAYSTGMHTGKGLKTESITPFQTRHTEFDSMFFHRTDPPLNKKIDKIVRKSGFVARSLSDRHWIEEWVKITDSHISFYNPEKFKANFRLSVDNVVKMERLEPENSPQMTCYSFMSIETKGRTIYLMFPSSKDRDNWLTCLSEVRSNRVIADTGSISSDSRGSNSSEYFVAVDDPTDEFLHKSSMWNCKQRTILNCRKLSFQSKELVPNAHLAVEDALIKAAAIKQGTEDASLYSFLDSAAVLKDVDIRSLGEKDRVAFFLNLYHLMIMHSYLVLGPPTNSFKWITYFNAISYQVSDDIFSLTELEHCIIRAPMNYPTQFVSKFVLPKSQFHFALTQPDYRINFALNPGSLSNPQQVPIYKVATLDQQLDSNCQLFLGEAVELVVKRNTTVVTLPRICVWFLSDFSKYGSTNELLKKLEPFLAAPQRKRLTSCWSEQQQQYVDVTVKYHAYNFECRSLRIES